VIVAARPDPRSARLLAIDAGGTARDLPRAALGSLFKPGDLLVANDAATLPASLHGTHAASGGAVEVRLAGWASVGDPTRFVALVLGAGDYRTMTQDRAAPPPLSAGDHLSMGPLVARVERLLGHARLLALHFLGSRDAILRGIARHGRPIQYAHVPKPLALWEIWTPIAAAPVAFEAPSAGFALDWRTLAAWRQRAIGFATLTHAAGISSTGDAALDLRLPFDEPYRIPETTATAINRANARGGRIIAVGTTVVRALESAATADGNVRAGAGLASGRIGRARGLGVVDAILTGVHQAGESHFELLQAFAEDAALDRITALAEQRGYRTHEFGDSLLIERQAGAPLRRDATPGAHGSAATVCGPPATG
jgi:S-adenosylmethionine:tRNA ribosyltransferase-isomerase